MTENQGLDVISSTDLSVTGGTPITQDLIGNAWALASGDEAKTGVLTEIYHAFSDLRRASDDRVRSIHALRDSSYLLVRDARKGKDTNESRTVYATANRLACAEETIRNLTGTIERLADVAVALGLFPEANYCGWATIARDIPSVED